jgi:hypothetical protein
MGNALMGVMRFKYLNLDANHYYAILEENKKS